jgi:ABC-type dipeptide/oligopeptide/nickel transport system permease component
VIVENVFAIPGMGSLLVSSVSNRDYPVVQALVVIFAGTVVVSSLVTDMLYLVVDPRIRL